MGSDDNNFNVLIVTCEGQSHDSVHRLHSFWRAEAELTDVLLTSLTPDRWAKPAHSDKDNSTRTVLLPMCCEVL